MDSIHQWDCRGMQSHLVDLKSFIKQNTTCIICLQQTKIGTECLTLGCDHIFFKSNPPPGNGTKGDNDIERSNCNHSVVPLRATLQTLA